MKTIQQIAMIEKQLNKLKSDFAKSNRSGIYTTPAEKREQAESFYKKTLGLSIVERGLKVNLPTKEGLKTFEGIRFNNGKVAVFCRGDSVLKYAWK